MVELRLVKPLPVHREQYEQMMEEWEAFGGRLHPGALRRFSRKQGRNVSFDEWLRWIEEDSAPETCPPGTVPQQLYFLMDDRERILGAVTLRPKLNDALLLSGGNMGLGIRPTERRKGYATRMIALAVKLLTEQGLNRVLITCDRDNVGSAGAIRSNGGVIENEIVGENGNIVQRYWIYC